MSNRQKRGCILVLVGLCMVLAAMGLHMAQQKQDDLAGENARVLLQQLELSRTPVPEIAPEPTEVENDPAQSLPVQTAPVDPTMPEKEYLDYSMIGTLRIEQLGMLLPILSHWDYDLLNVAPCRYSGSIPTEDMILMGHNYKSHFTPLHKITLGTQVEFEDVNGVIYRYEVAQIVHLHKSELEQLPSEYPLTLFTCTPGGQNRIIVRCAAVESEN